MLLLIYGVEENQQTRWKLSCYRIIFEGTLYIHVYEMREIQRLQNVSKVYIYRFSGRFQGDNRYHYVYVLPMYVYKILY